MAVVPESYIGIMNQIVRIQASYERLYRNMKIGVFFQRFVTEKDLQKLFEWCWERGIINIFVASFVDPSRTTIIAIF